ncbi:unnamed protein product [Sphagnum jensenii]|uniref:Uncharacterized protein n=1 Tax=Sphagnum jensenii TaxID=128206 RepID=A0ABP1A2Y1_9BRYO
MSEERDTELASVGQKLAKAKAKEVLMTLLPKAATMLEEVEQSPPSSTIYAMKACSDALVDPALLRHKDKDVGLLVALCISEIMRIVAPDAPYSDDCLKEIFQLIVDIFRELDDVDSPFFSSRVNILETVAKVRSCVVMLDLECDDLITEMFRIFFTTASDKHPEHVFLAMRNVLSLVIEEGEEVSSQILEIILNNLLRQKEGVSEAGHKLAVAVVENSADNLEPYVRSFLTLEGNVKDDHKEVTVEDDNKEVTVVEGTTNNSGLGDLQVADEANSHEDEKGLSRKEEVAGVDHEDGSEGHKQERVDDQAEEETKGEIGVKGSKEDSKDGQEDDEPGKETMENDKEDHDENLPAKRTCLPEGSSKNHHVRDPSSEDKKDEEEGGEDDQDVDQTPQQSDEKEHEKDLVENLSTKRKPGQGSKRKLPVGDGRAHRSREENVDPKRKRGLPENSIKKGEVLDEDVNNDRNQQELDVSPPKSKHKLPKNSVDKGIEYVLNGHDKDGDMDTEENLTPKSKAGHAKASGKKESRRVSSGKGGKQEEKEEGGDQTPKHKAGRPKGGSGGKEITYPSADRGGDEGLVGCGIKVWWPLDRRFYKGEVVSYNAKKKKHKVLYDDGEQEILDLVQERWELITKKQRPVKNPPDASPTPAWAPVPLKELTKAKALAQQEDVQRPSEKVKKQSLSKSGKKGLSKESKPNNLEAKFLEAKSPVNTISAFDFDEDDDGEAPRGGTTKRKPTQSSSTPKGSSGKIFKLVSSTKPSAKDDSSDTLGDGEPLNTWVIQRQKAR